MISVVLLSSKLRSCVITSVWRNKEAYGRLVKTSFIDVLILCILIFCTHAILGNSHSSDSITFFLSSLSSGWYVIGKDNSFLHYSLAYEDQKQNPHNLLHCNWFRNNMSTRLSMSVTFKFQPSYIPEPSHPLRALVWIVMALVWNMTLLKTY